MIQKTVNSEAEESWRQAAALRNGFHTYLELNPGSVGFRAACLGSRMTSDFKKYVWRMIYSSGTNHSPFDYLSSFSQKRYKKISLLSSHIKFFLIPQGGYSILKALEKLPKVHCFLLSPHPPLITFSYFGSLKNAVTAFYCK